MHEERAGGRAARRHDGARLDAERTVTLRKSGEAERVVANS